jgi:hypothetical protein
MLADLDETLRQLLVAEMPVKNGEIDIEFDQPKREWSSRLTRPTVNFFLYDLRENAVLRQHQWEQVPGANGRGRDSHLAHLKRTPFRVDCLYMLTCWAAEPEDEHRLLSRAMLALFRFPVLPPERLVGILKGQPYELQTRLASHDRLTNPAEVWSALDNEMRPSLSYIVTLSMDPWTEITAPLVKTFSMRSGQAEGLPHYRRLIDSTVVEWASIGGQVRAGAGGEPQAGIQVAVKGSGLFAASDEHGHYSLNGLPPGEYVLVAWPAKGRPLEKKVTLPGKPGDYDFEL